MDKIVLNAEPRPHAGRHALRELRLQNRVPAVIYGREVESQNVAIDRRELQRALVQAGTGLIALQVGGGAQVQVLAREVQRDPIKHRALHVDFQAVSMTETLRLAVPVVVEGTAPAMSNPDVVLMHAIDEVEVECLPTDIPRHLVANISQLQTVEDSFYVRDLVLPPGVKVLTDPEQVLIALTMSRAAVEEEAVEEEAPAADQVEVVGKGKKEEEEEA